MAVTRTRKALSWALAVAPKAGPGSPVLSPVMLTVGGAAGAGFGVLVNDIVGAAVPAATLSLTETPSVEFSSTSPRALPANSVNQTCPVRSSTEIIRGDELLVGMLNSVSCRVAGSNLPIRLAMCSLNHTSPEEETVIQYGSVKAYSPPVNKSDVGYSTKPAESSSTYPKKLDAWSVNHRRPRAGSSASPTG